MTELRHESGAIPMFHEYIEAWGTHRTDRVLAFFADECVYENLARGEVYRGKDELGAWVAGAFAGIPDTALELTSLFASGRWVGCEWVMTGTHTGDLPDLPATGKSFSIRGATVAEVSGGKIVRAADYWDLASFLRQLGVMP
ncbi:MAG: hypothetical protein EPN53_12155 [Acidobacteria bacterium]|nr:MAG: hypothetical protein EPN53_12155 [Acidobacteriota bacterium]